MRPKIYKYSKKRFHLNKKEILFWVSKARRYLNLPKINVEIRKINYLCLSKDDCPSYNTIQRKVILPQLASNLEVETESNSRLHDAKKICLWVIFHEIAHAFQFYYYPVWAKKYSQYEYYVAFQGKHKDKKLEKNANKIAVILFKKLYKD